MYPILKHFIVARTLKTLRAYKVLPKIFFEYRDSSLHVKELVVSNKSWRSYVRITFIQLNPVEESLVFVNFYNKQGRRLNGESNEYLEIIKKQYAIRIPAQGKNKKFTFYLELPRGTYQLKVSAECNLSELYKAVQVSFIKDQKIKNFFNLLNSAVYAGSDFANFKQNQIKEYLDYSNIQKDQKAAKLNKYIFQHTFEHIKEKDTIEAIEFGEKCLKLNPSKVMLEGLVGCYKSIGNIKRVVELLEKKQKLYGGPPDKNYKKLKDACFLLEQGYQYPCYDTVREKYDVKRKAFYILHNSLPYNSGGYATRSHGLLKAISSHNFDITAISRFNYPTDKNILLQNESGIIDGVPYLRMGNFQNSGSIATFHDYGYVTLRRYLEVSLAALEEHCRGNNPAIIHAASFYTNGLLANQVARKLGLKSIYEVRGLFELTKISLQPEFEESEQILLHRRLEVQAMNDANRAFTITNALKRKMHEWGVNKEIIVVPNSVDTQKFFPTDRNVLFAKSLGIKEGDVVIGYVGSIVEYEGLDDLLLAAKKLYLEQLQFKIIIIGDGKQQDFLKKMVENLKLKEVVIFTGRVPHNEVQKYFSIIDIMPFPRKPLMVCDMVSPLKPFESLASRKAVLVSSCDALTEIIQDQKTGLVFRKGNIDELTYKLRLLIEKKELRDTLSENGLKWVQSERDWKVISSRVIDIYDDLCDELAFERAV